MSPKGRLCLYALLLLFGYGVGYGLDILSSVLLSQDAAATLASYAIVRQAVNVAVSFFRFISNAARAVVARRDAAKQFDAIPAIVRQVVLFSVAAGLVGCGLVIALRSTLIESVTPEDEELVPETEHALIIYATGGILNVVYGGLFATLVGLFQFAALLALGLMGGATFSFLSIFLFLQTDLGLNAFSVAYLIFNTVAVLMSVFFLYGLRSNRERYGFTLASLKSHGASGQEWATEFRNSISWLWGQSSTIVIRSFLGTVLVVSSGTANGAVYALVLSFSGITQNVADIVAYTATIIGPRLLGIKEEGEDGAAAKAKNYGTFLVWANFSWRLSAFWGVAVCAAFGLLGEALLLSADDGSGDIESVITAPLLIVFAVMQVFLSAAVSFEGVLVAAHDFNFVGRQCLVAFLVAFLPIILAAHLEDEAPLARYLLADVAFYLLRSVFCVARWFFVVRPRLLKAKEHTASALALGNGGIHGGEEDDALPGLCLRNLVYVVCMCQSFRDVRRTVNDLARSINLHTNNDENDDNKKASVNPRVQPDASAL